MRNNEIASELRLHHQDRLPVGDTALRNRASRGIEKDAPRSVPRTEASAALVEQIIHKTLHESPPNRARWSTRSLAAALGTSPAMVQRVWKTHGLTASQRPSNAAS